MGGYYLRLKKKQFSKKTVLQPGVLAHAFHTNTWKAKAGRSSEVKASLVYILQSKFKVSQNYIVKLCQQQQQQQQYNQDLTEALATEKPGMAALKRTAKQDLLDNNKLCVFKETEGGKERLGQDELPEHEKPQRLF